MEYRIKTLLPLLALCTLLSACGQPSAADKQTPPSAPVETPSPTPTPAESSVPLTLAGEELDTAVMWDYGNVSSGASRYDGSKRYTKEEAQLDQRFLEWGFSVDEPFYEYDMPEGNVGLTLFYDEEQERGLGIYRNYGENIEGKEYLYGIYGFGFEGISDGKGWGRWDRWMEDPFDLPLDCDGVVKECWEEWEYDQEGRAATGNVYAKVDDPRFEDQNRVLLYQAEYTYDENHILRHKTLWHNFSIVYGVDAHDSWYDVQGRLCYEEGYITHGSLRYYYIYAGESQSPSYCLYIDNNMGYSDAILIRY